MSDPSRRRLVIALGAAAAALPLARSYGADAAKVDVHDPQAVALGYIENATRVDAKKYPQFVPGSNCENCLQLQGKPGNNFRPCALFSGKLVAVAGWCTGWAAEM
jgi:High potential iron-sulfur protein